MAFRRMAVPSMAVSDCQGSQVAGCWDNGRLPCLIQEISGSPEPTLYSQDASLIQEGTQTLEIHAGAAYSTEPLVAADDLQQRALQLIEGDGSHQRPGYGFKLVPFQPVNGHHVHEPGQ